ncbi:MAG TPA: penicillin-binding transpeptidase domain-containing protein [Pyrinomonadaceae bacterium]|nr:penicillin-binding transpeptidase domain-containing protein [Pyrinomonadaceae bacterium]
MFPYKLRIAAVLTLLAVFVFANETVNAQKKAAQSKKAASAKVPDKKSATAKKTDKKSKDASKTSKADKNDKKKGKDTVADTRSKKGSNKSVESKKEVAERRRRDQERRQAAIAEQRRREQAAREARQRRVAFERGLRTETIANISNDNTEGEDLNIRRAAIDALGGRAGSVVVMEAQTGKVLTIVNQNWAIRSTIRPCSTVKLVTGVVALNENVIDKQDGSVRNVSTRRKLDDAIAFSDNAYFQRAGVQMGSPKVIEYAKRLGLGEATGINLDGEAPGRLPYGNNNARIYSHGDDFEVSTLQLAVMVSAITNGGHRVLPRVPRNAIEQTKFQTFFKGNVDLPQQNVRRVIPGMMGAAEYGTAHRGVDAGLGVAGKTGSCIDKGSWVGLFASVAPIESPKYAVAVITRGPAERGKYAASVAGKVYQALSRNIIRTDRNLAQTEFNIAPRTPVNTATARVDVSEEDEDDSVAGSTGMETTNMNGRDIILVPSAPRQTSVPVQKGRVQKTVDSRPIFPTVVITPETDPTKKKRERIVQLPQ